MHVCLDQLRPLGGLLIPRIDYGTDFRQNAMKYVDKSPKRPEFRAFGDAVACPASSSTAAPAQAPLLHRLKNSQGEPIAGMAIRQTLKANRYTKVPAARSRSFREQRVGGPPAANSGRARRLGVAA